jgi:hypothetical protein
VANPEFVSSLPQPQKFICSSAMIGVAERGHEAT